MAEKGLAKLEPLFFGRLTRVLFGIATLYWAYTVREEPVFLAILAFLGISFLLGGLLGHPGCEITVIPNLLVSPEKRAYCV